MVILDNESQVCLITGGSAGIGLATAKLLAEQGYQIAICGRNQNRLDSAVELIGGLGTECLGIVQDLGSNGAAENIFNRVIDHFGRLDVLVNNAALSPFGPFEAITSEVFESAIALNVRAVFELSQQAWRQMKEQRSGVVVNVSSLAAVDPFTGFSLYGATKAFMDLLTVALADEGKDLGIRVYSIRPGAVETEMLRGLFPEFPSDQCVSPNVIAKAIWKCVSEPENYVSGSHHAVTKQP